jgi:hypothetical protein
VIIGSIIGVLSAWIGYHIFWPNPCSVSTFKFESASQPRSLYVELDENNSERVEFELAPVDEGTNAV